MSSLGVKRDWIMVALHESSSLLCQEKYLTPTTVSLSIQLMIHIQSKSVQPPHSLKTTLTGQSFKAEEFVLI